MLHERLCWGIKENINITAIRKREVKSDNLGKCLSPV
jgi:hypothetical protein